MKKNIYIYNIPIHTQILQVIYTDMHIQEVGKRDGRAT